MKNGQTERASNLTPRGTRSLNVGALVMVMPFFQIICFKPEGEKKKPKRGLRSLPFFLIYISLWYWRLMLVNDVIDCTPSNMGPAGKLELPLWLLGLCNARLGDVIARAQGPQRQKWQCDIVTHNTAWQINRRNVIWHKWALLKINYFVYLIVLHGPMPHWTLKVG